MFYLPNYVFYIFLSPKGRTGSNKIFIGMPIIPLMECILQTPQIQLHEIANHIFNASVSAFSPQTSCRAMYRLGITRKKVSRSQEAKIYSLLPVCLVTLNMLSSM